MTLNKKNHYFINLYLCFVYCLILILMSFYSSHIDNTSTTGSYFTLYVWLCYSFLYLLPLLVFSKLLLFIENYFFSGKYHQFAFMIIFIMSIVMLAFLYSDYYLFSLYGYHIDSFVVNLLLTSGGIESLGITSSTITTVTIQVVISLLVMFVLSFLLYREVVIKANVFIKITINKYVLLIFFLFFSLEEIAHGVFVSLGDFNVVQASSVFPLNFNTTFNSLLKKSGFKTVASMKKMSHGTVNYPLEALVYKKPEKPFNVVWLVAESLRWDMLTPEIMPNTWAFAQKNLYFKNHYSGGNRTRMGMFAMFYGLYAPYWYAFEEQRIGSPVLDILMAEQYQLRINTSQSFSYPELNHTVFVHVPKENMRELNSLSETWKRDENNISDLIHFIDTRDRNRPFFNFMFFEATHAPYQFPQEAVIRKDYIKEMNYAKLNLVSGISKIKNRYINAAHYVDSQIGRLLDELKKQGLEQETIVIITGDHGEEFMEKGHWGHGHNAVFPEEQIHVPLVMAIPGKHSEVINHLSSHLDLPATILPLLGVTSNPDIYSFGQPILSNKRSSMVIGNYNYISYMDSQYKLTFPFTGKSGFELSIRTFDDRLVTRAHKLLIREHYKPMIDNLFKESKRFICKECKKL